MLTVFAIANFGILVKQSASPGQEPDVRILQNRRLVIYDV
jgi:hypothetical protein